MTHESPCQGAGCVTVSLPCGPWCHLDTSQVGWARDTGLAPYTAMIRGVDVRASWRPSPTPGTYWLSYVVPGSDAQLFGVPPTVQLQLVDPRCVHL